METLQVTFNRDDTDVVMNKKTITKKVELLSPYFFHNVLYLIIFLNDSDGDSFNIG